MPLPGDVSVFTLTGGPYTDATGFGELAGATGTLKPVDANGRPIQIYHPGDGSVIVPEAITVTIQSDGTWSVVGLAHTDDTHLTPTPFLYQLTWNVPAYRSSLVSKTIAVPITAGSTVDYDALVATTTTTGAQVNIPAVLSVNGRNGAVTLAASDVGLGNVNNTSDANKPVSTATQTALNAKQDTATLGATVAADPTVRAAYAPGGIQGRRRDRLPGFLVPDKQVMASPPTVGAVASASAITSGVTTSPLTGGGGSSSSVDTTAPFLYLGIGPIASIARYGSSFPDYNYVKSTHKTTTNTASPHHSVSFGFDGTTLEIKLRNTGNGAYRLRVDGQLVSAAATSYTTPTQGWLPVTFATRAPRTITVELWNVPFGGVVVGPNDTVWKPQARGPRVVVFGDSYTNGTGTANGPIEGYVQTFADLMGWHDIVESGVGGTGYLAPGTGGTVKFRDRVANDVVNLNPDIVIVCGGHNDTSYLTSDLQTEATALFQAIKAASTKPLLWVVGPFFQGGSASSYTAIQTALFAAASGIADATIDTTTAPWFTGTGRVGATTGSGNSDLYISSDAVHPTTPGHTYMARRMAEAATALLAA